MVVTVFKCNKIIFNKAFFSFLYILQGIDQLINL